MDIIDKFIKRFWDKVNETEKEYVCLSLESIDKFLNLAKESIKEENNNA